MSTPIDDSETVTRLRAALDELTAATPGQAPPLDDRPTYTGRVVPLSRRRWVPTIVAVAAVAAAVVAAIVLTTRRDRPSAPPVPATSPPAETTVAPAPVEAPLPQVTLDLPGAVAGAIQTEQLSPPDDAHVRVYATPGVAPERVLVIQTTVSEFDPPSPEGDYTMDPVAAPTGQAWILHAVLDEPGNHVPVDQGVVWWSTGNGRELVKVSGQGLTDAELIAVLPDLRQDGPEWAYEAPASTRLEPVARPPLAGPYRRSVTDTALASGEKVTIEVQTGGLLDLLLGSTFYLPAPAGVPATATLPDGTIAVVRSDPGAYHVFWRSGDTAFVHLTARQTEDLAAILSAIRTTPG